MKAVKELNKLKEDALKGRLSELKKELMKLRSQVASGTVPKNPGRIKVPKKDDSKNSYDKHCEGKAKE